MQKQNKMYANRSCSKLLLLLTLTILASTVYYYHISQDSVILKILKINRTNNLKYKDTSQESHQKKPQQIHPKTPQQIYPKKHNLFAFLIQTKQCLPEYLRTNAYFGNHAKCNCHVYVLSYKKACVEKLPETLSHIKHLYKAGTLWSSGRNNAFYAAKKSGYQYIYYIFMDDDIVVEYNELTPKHYIDNKTPALQIFTEYLLTHKPAVAAPEYNHWNRVKDVLHTWHHTCKVEKQPYVIPLWHHDAAFEAFHHNTSDILLPYEEKFDKMLYFLSAVVTTLRINVAFYGQHMYFPYVKAVNQEHRYLQNGNIHPPSRFLCDRKVRTEMVDDIRKWIPSKYKDHAVLDLISKFPLMKIEHTQCRGVPDGNSYVIPYTYMYNKTETRYPVKDRCNW